MPDTLVSAGFFNVYAELGPAFEKSTGHKLITTRGPSLGNSPEAIPTRLARGEESDHRSWRNHLARGVTTITSEPCAEADSHR